VRARERRKIRADVGNGSYRHYSFCWSRRFAVVDG